jgi:hypothetical protein
MTCTRYYFTNLEIEQWAFDWSPLPGSDSVHCLAAIFHMFGVRQIRGRA